MKRAAWCAAVAVVALTGCKSQEPPAPAPALERPAAVMPPEPSPEPLSPEALARQPVLTSLEEALKQPEKVYRLDLSARPGAPRLGTLPAEVGTLVRLQELSLSGQGLTELPRELGHLRALQSLDLSGNALVTLPEELGRLMGLKELRLSGNRLKEFPGFIVKLPELQTLTLYANPFQVSLALGQVGTLRTVNVDEGQADLDALREALPSVRWEVHTEAGPVRPAAASGDEVAWPEAPEPEAP